MVRGIAFGVALCGIAEIDFAVVDTRGQSPCAFPHTGDSPHVSESGASGADSLADGRHQCAVVVACGDCNGLGLGLHPTVEAALMDRSADSACGLLARRAGDLAVCFDTCHAAWLEASLDGWLVGGRAADGLCMAFAAVAVAAGDDRSELLPHSSALSPMEWLR